MTADTFCIVLLIHRSVRQSGIPIITKTSAFLIWRDKKYAYIVPKEVMKLEQRISDLAAGTERRPENDGGNPELSNDRGIEITSGTKRQGTGEKLDAQCVSGLYG